MNYGISSIFPAGSRPEALVDGAGQLIGAGGAVAALDTPEKVADFLGFSADDHFAQALGVASASAVDPAFGNDSVTDFKVDGFGARPEITVMIPFSFLSGRGHIRLEDGVDGHI